MSIQSKRQWKHTLAKLKILDDRLRELEIEPVANARTRELTKQSLKKIINQLKEEIVRFEAHQMEASL